MQQQLMTMSPRLMLECFPEPRLVASSCLADTVVMFEETDADEFEVYRARSYSGGFSPAATSWAFRQKNGENRELACCDGESGSSARDLRHRGSPSLVCCTDSPNLFISSTGRKKVTPTESQVVKVSFEKRFESAQQQQQQQQQQQCHHAETRQRLGSGTQRSCHPVGQQLQQLVVPSSLSVSYHPLRKVRSFTIIRNRLVREEPIVVNKFRQSASASEGFGRSRCDFTAAAAASGSFSASPASAPVYSAAFKVPSLTVAGMTDAPVHAEKYKVLITGTKGVGKSAIISQFLKLDKSNELDCMQEEVRNCETTANKSATVILDGEEATLEFVDLSDSDGESEQFATSDCVSAYVVVYSVEDRKSFEAAIDRLYEIRDEDNDRPSAVILVANKVDLVRSRLVLAQEGKNTAKQYACKYIEVSATIDHQIDELFVGILKQIRLIASCSSGGSTAAISSSAYPPHSQLIHADDADDEVTSTSCLCSGRGKQHSPSQERRYEAASASLGWNSEGGNASGGVQSAGDRNSQRHWTLQDTCCLLRARDNALSRMLMKGMGRGSRSCSNLYVL